MEDRRARSPPPASSGDRCLRRHLGRNDRARCGRKHRTLCLTWNGLATHGLGPAAPHPAAGGQPIPASDTTTSLTRGDRGQGPGATIRRHDDALPTRGAAGPRSGADFSAIPDPISLRRRLWGWRRRLTWRSTAPPTAIVHSGAWPRGPPGGSPVPWS